MSVRSLILIAFAGCATVSRVAPPQILDGPPPPDPELAASGARLAADEIARVKTPLAAEARFGDFAVLARPEAAATTAQLRASITAMGQATCNALDASTPFASWLASRYCAHFGVTRAPLALPGGGYGSILLDDTIAGEPASARAELANALQAALRASRWYAPGAPALHVAVTGSLEVKRDSKPVGRNAHYTVEVDGVVTRGQRYGVCDPETENCDDPVTFWEPRDFSYVVTEEHGTYAARLRADVAPLGIAATEQSSFTRVGDDSDINNPDAGLSPTRANLPTDEAFAVAEGKALADHLRQELEGAFVEQACRGAGSSYEAAAKCAYADPARAAPQLAPVFGADAPLLAPLLR